MNHFRRFEKRYSLIGIVIYALFFAQVSFSSPTTQAEHEAASADARSFFNTNMRPGLSEPSFDSATGGIGYQQYDSATGTWISTTDTVTNSPAEYDAAEMNNVQSGLSSTANDPGAINSAVSNTKASASPDDPLNELLGAAASNSHPSYWDDPYMVLTREIIGGIPNNPEVGSDCTTTTVNTDTTTTHTNTWNTSCTRFAPPPTCSIKREITRVDEINSCMPGTLMADGKNSEQGLPHNGWGLAFRWAEPYEDITQTERTTCYGKDDRNCSTSYTGFSHRGGSHKLNVQAMCGGNTQGNHFKFMRHAVDHLCCPHHEDAYIPVDNDNNWKPVPGTTVHHAYCKNAYITADTDSLTDAQAVNPTLVANRWICKDWGFKNTLVYRNHQCVETGVAGVDGWDCSIDISVFGTDDPIGSVPTGNYSVTDEMEIGWVCHNGLECWDDIGAQFMQNDPAIYSAGNHITIEYKALHTQYIVHESKIYEPAGCEQSDFCQIESDPYWTAPSGDTSTWTLEELASDDIWECVDADNNRKPTNSPVPIDPTNQYLEGIYYPTAPISPGNGPLPLIDNTDPYALCWEARARNYNCGLDNSGGGDDFWSGINLERPDGTMVTGGDAESIIQQSIAGCDHLATDPTCAMQNESVLVSDNTGIPLFYEQEYECGITFDSTSFDSDTTTVCTGTIPCIGEECFSVADESNDDFNEFAVRASVLGEAKHNLECQGGTPEDCRVFGGEPLFCRSGGWGAQDCCKDEHGASDLAGYMAAYEFGRILVQETDIVGQTYNLVAPDIVQKGVAGAWKYVAESYSGAETYIVENFVTPVTNKISTYAAEMGITTAAEAAIADSTVSTVYSSAVTQAAYQMLSFCASCQSALFTETLITEGGKTITTVAPNSYIASAFNVIMYTYLAYQLTMLALSMMYACEEVDINYVQRRKVRACTAETSQCLSDGPFGGCAGEERKGACCFATPLGRILHEAAVVQGVRPPTGSMESGLNCDGLNMVELDALDWDVIDFTEWTDTLKASLMLPDGSEETNDFFSIDNITRGTVMSDALYEHEKGERENRLQQYEDNKSEAETRVIDLEALLIDIQNKIDVLNVEIAALQAKIASGNFTIIDERQLQVKLDERDDLENQLIATEEDRDRALQTIADMEIAIANHVPLDDDPYVRSDALGRIEEKWENTDLNNQIDNIRQIYWGNTP